MIRARVAHTHGHGAALGFNETAGSQGAALGFNETAGLTGQTPNPLFLALWRLGG